MQSNRTTVETGILAAFNYRVRLRSYVNAIGTYDG